MCTTVYFAFQCQCYSGETGNKEYGPYRIVLNKGTYSVSFYISITDDMKVEEDEQFILTIALPPGVISEEPSQATVTVVDNDCK